MIVNDRDLKKKIVSCELIDTGYPLAYGILGQFRHTVQTEFFHNVHALGLNGFDTDTELESDLLGIFAIGDEVQYILFTPGKRRVMVVGALVTSLGIAFDD